MYEISSIESLLGSSNTIPRVLLGYITQVGDYGCICMCVWDVCGVNMGGRMVCICVCMGGYGVRICVHTYTLTPTNSVYIHF